MRTKLISLLLCLSALLTLSFTSCGESNDSEDSSETEQKTARTAVSVKMYVVSEKEVDEETAALVESAFSAYTESKYTTRVDLDFFTVDEYFDILDADLEEAANIKATSEPVVQFPVMMGEETTEAVTTEIVEETYVDDRGQTRISSPDIKEGQIDIVFLAGKDLLERYVTEGKLMSIEEKLNSSDAKVLKDYIYPSAINQIKVDNGGTVPQAYAVPNNAIIGEYTYLLVNKEMADKYYIDLDNIDSLIDCADLIADIGNNEKDVAPVLSYVNPVNMQYWLDMAGTEDGGELTFTVGNTEANVFGAKRELPAVPVADGNTVMVPLEFFAKALDSSYAFKTSTSTATLTYGTRVIRFVVGSNTADVNGETVALPSAVYIDEESGEIMAPANFIADSLCATFENDESASQYVIKVKDFGGLSLLASYAPADATLGDYVEMTSAFAIPEFTEHMILMQECEENGWFAEDPENTEDFGVAVVTGSYESMKEYDEKYAVKVISYPTLTDEDVYDAMYAVTSYTVDIDRALEILTLIYTDTTAKNILQYGVEGVHYEFDDEGNFVVLNDDYCMNNNYTGNAFLAYTTSDVPADIWDNAKATNLDSRVFPFFGMEKAWENVGSNHNSTLRKISNVMFDEMEECANSDELAAFFAEAQALIDENEAFQTAIGNVPEIDPSEIIPGEEIVEDLTTPYVIYSQWGAKNWNEEGKAAFAAFEEAREAAKEAAKLEEAAAETTLAE